MHPSSYDVLLNEIPQDQRKAYLEEKVLYYASFVPSTRVARCYESYDEYKEKMSYTKLRRLWNNEFTEERYKYLNMRHTKEQMNDNLTESEIVELGMPAVMQHIPVVKSRLLVLQTKERKQPFKPQVIAVDDEANQRKKKDLMDTIDSYNESQQAMANKAYEEIKELETLLEAMVQQQQTEQQQTQQPPSIEFISKVKSLNEQLQKLKQLKMNYESYDANNLKTIYRQRQHSYKDRIEIVCGKLFENYKQQHNLEKLFNDGMEEFLITDEEIYFVHFEKGNLEPETRLVRPENITYSISDNSVMLDEADYICEYIQMTKPEIRARLSRFMDKDQIECVESGLFASSYATFINDGYGWDIEPDGRFVDYGNISRDMHSQLPQYEVYRVFWKERSEVRTLWKKKSADEIDESDFDDYEFVDFVTKEEVKKLPKNKAKEYQVRVSYRNDLWEAYVVNRMVIGLRKVKDAIRYPHNMMDVKMPYIGYAYNKYHKPDSLFQKCIPLQDNYNVIHYKEQLLYNLSGVKGIIFDEAQRPDGMSWAEWFHFRKNGTIPKKSYVGDRKVFTDNHMGTYDDTLPATIQNYALAKASILQIVALITGINDQTLGEIDQKAMVGNTQIALEQSEIITQFYFQRHEYLKTLVTERLVNLFPQAYKNGKRGNFLLGNKQELFNFKKDELNGFFRVYTRSGEDEVKILNAIRQFAEKQAVEGTMSLRTFIDILDNDIISDAKFILEQAQKEQQLLAQKNQEQAAETQKQVETELRKLDGEIQMRIAEQQGKQLKELEQIKGQLKIQHEKVKADLDLKKTELDNLQNKDNTNAQIGVMEKQINSKEVIEKAKMDLEDKYKQSELELEKARLLIEQLKAEMEMKQKLSTNIHK